MTIIAMLRGILGVLLVLAALLISRAHGDISILERAGLKLGLVNNSLGGLSFTTNTNGVTKIIAVLGRRSGEIRNVNRDEDITITYPNDTTVTIATKEVTSPRNGQLVTISWKSPNTVRLEDCINLAGSHWYGGPQQKRQYWPIEKLVLPEYSYVPKEADNCGIAEPYWLNSEGTFFFINRNSPLFVDQNTLTKDAACLVSQVKAPYSSKRTNNDLEYVIGIFDDARAAHEYAVETFLKKPSGFPDERMITYPIWSTWARYKTNVNHDVVLAFADEINKYGFPNSQLEIDDLWEVCYGSQTVDVNRFPNMKKTVDNLKERGYRVTIWTHPFLNKNCEPWYSEAKDQGYLVESESGSVETSWWNDNGTTTGYIDFTKPEARQWYTERLQALQNSYGIDSFKFDGGETSWSPLIPVLQGNVTEQPGIITEAYVRTVATFGPMVEVRSGWRTQDLPVFVRMIDKDTYWTFENGLPTLITTLLQMNMNGYTLVLPDMIGGNGYNEPPSKELFIRWLQANTFMPSMQFSYVPWDFDNETIAISKKFVDLHEKYAPAIIAALNKTVQDGTPVNPPIWWIAPNDTTAHEIWDQYLLGEDIIVAPVIEENATARDIYLPAGRWQEGGDPRKLHEGPTWVRNFSAPLDVLPYFVRDSRDSAHAPAAAILLIAFAIVVHMFNIC